MQIVDKVCRILNEFLGAKELTASEIAERVEIPISTAYRILSSLTEHGLLEKDNRSKLYSLGWKLVNYGKNVREADSNKYMVSKMVPLMREVAETVGETVTLATFTGTRVVLIAVVNGKRSLQFYGQLGREMPWHASAPAKLLLAMQPAKIRKKVVNSMSYTRYTDETICDPAQFEEELARVRKEEIAYSEKELEDSCYAISVPVCDATKRTILAITVTGYAPRMAEHRQEITDLLRGAALRANEIFRTNGFCL